MDIMSLEAPLILGMSGTLLAVHGPKYVLVFDLTEGKAHPRQARTLYFEDLGGKTVGLLLRMVKIYFITGGYVSIDYGLCVLKGLIKLRKKGIFDCDVIKKKRYRPSTVPDKYTEDNFGDVEVAETYAIQGTVDDII